MLYPLETEQARKAGDEWARSHQSLALSVKSHVVPPDRNVLLNPVHPAFSMVTVLQQDSFKLDDRMAF